jgi:hypothetical protein
MNNSTYSRLAAVASSTDAKRKTIDRAFAFAVIDASLTCNSIPPLSIFNSLKPMLKRFKHWPKVRHQQQMAYVMVEYMSFNACSLPNIFA